MSIHLDDLTVFIISSGEETEADCISALKSQDCTFRIEQIRGVTPMSAAFQAMPDRCQTPYFIQLDADMILKPHAVKTLYNAVKGSPFWVYRIAGTLYEEGFGIGGAVKCWKKSVFRFASFRDCRTVDRDFHRRVRRIGLTIKRIDDVLGVHRPRHSNYSLYLKTKADVEKWRYLKRPSTRYALPLLDEILENDESRPYRLLGALCGAMTGPNRLVRSKDALFEDGFYIDMLTFLGNDHDSLEMKSDPDGEPLRRLFASCYDDFQGNNTSCRTALAEQIISMYGGNGNSQSDGVNALLRMANQ